ncbi:MAG: LutB/LldF family L-lactate oxidation iron-sulfur protein [Calditrichia bacterium]
MQSRSHLFKEDLPSHLNNSTMRQNVDRATWLSMNKREKVIAEIDWHASREQARQIKKEVVDNLEVYLEQFIEQAESQGISVQRASSAKEAVELAGIIAQENNVKRVVKSKSMLTEEIGLNDYLQSLDISVVETDLGEYIIQLNGDPPSHLTGPAIHLSRQEIGKIFQKYLGIPYSDDPETLTRAARERLRKEFLQADMGITGANFGIVENGCITVVENEGNARLCASLPDIHVAFIGMERLIPQMQDLGLFLPLLCRSSTGQRLTSFISTFGGPVSEEHPDGPEKVYYIIVDNGRSKLLADKRLKEALHCIRCGACYNSCPIYQNIGGHAYGWVYQGPIGAVITPSLLGLEKAKDLPFASSLCGTCSEVCPVKIPLHELLLYQREQVVEAGLQPNLEAFGMKAFVNSASSSRSFSRLIGLGKGLQRLLGSKLKVPGWSSSRNLPQPPASSFKELWRELQTDRDTNE